MKTIIHQIKGFLFCIVLCSFIGNVYAYKVIKGYAEYGYTDDMRVSMNDLMERVNIDKKRK